MFAYTVISFADCLPTNHRLFVLSENICRNNAIIIREDHKFAVFNDVFFRVCEFDPYEDREPNEELLLKVWIKDPFVGFEEYEQIPIGDSNWDLTLWR